MRRLLLLVIIVIAGAVVFYGWRNPSVRPFQLADGPERLKRARENEQAHLHELCRQAGLQYPPENLFLRAFKEEQVLEVWGGRKRQPLKLLTTFPWTATSGQLGPKRREGDRQIPEGCYLIERFNPESSFHLSLGLNYPNKSDLVFADPERPGSDIFIHGAAASIGCIAIGNEAIEKLYVLAHDVRQKSKSQVEVHIFPSKITETKWPELFPDAIAAQPTLTDFWANLEPVYRAFELTRIVPPVRVSAAGLYEVSRD